jgi:hypothetical protein
MRKALLFLAFFAFVSSLWAQDKNPTMGTWKLDIAKSKLPPTAANIKEIVLVFREIDADTMEGRSTQTTKDGKTTTARWTNPKNGGVQTYQEGAPASGISTIGVKVDPNTLYNLTLQNGKQVQLTPVVFDKAFKTYTMTYKGVDPQGKPYEFFALFEKQ